MAKAIPDPIWSNREVAPREYSSWQEWSRDLARSLVTHMRQEADVDTVATSVDSLGVTHLQWEQALRPIKLTHLRGEARRLVRQSLEAALIPRGHLDWNTAAISIADRAESLLDSLGYTLVDD